jgi:pyruvate dehydrogenase E2 component (dihydrolipoamide acetyltransferase)
LFEISTDKVDAEIPSPAAGTLLEIKVKEGETVAVNSVVATIGGAGEKAAASAEAKAEAVAETPPPSGKQQPHTSQADGTPTAAAPAGPAAPEHRTAPPAPSAPAAPEDRRHKSSPLVRKIAAEHGVDIRQITGSGIAGRVTKNDILGYIEKGAPTAHAPAAPAHRTAPSAPAAPSAPGSALRRYRLPVPARVQMQDGRPVRVMVDRRGVTGGAVKQSAGPWRTSGEWWNDGQVRQPYPTNWDRDEWDVLLTGGEAYRVYVEREVGQWFIEAVID